MPCRAAQVTDETFSQFSPPYAYSDVVRAVDYGYGKGARIFSMSFGNDARNGMTVSSGHGLATWSRNFVSSGQPGHGPPDLQWTHAAAANEAVSWSV